MALQWTPVSARMRAQNIQWPTYFSSSGSLPVRHHPSSFVTVARGACRSCCIRNHSAEEPFLRVYGAQQPSPARPRYSRHTTQRETDEQRPHANDQHNTTQAPGTERQATSAGLSLSLCRVRSATYRPYRVISPTGAPVHHTRSRERSRQRESREQSEKHSGRHPRIDTPVLMTTCSCIASLPPRRWMHVPPTNLTCADHESCQKSRGRRAPWSQQPFRALSHV